MIRQGFQNPSLPQGARLPTHTWRLSDPKQYVSARDMYGAKADVGRQIAASLQGVGNNIRQDRMLEEQRARQDAIRAEQQARSDARYADQQKRQTAEDARRDQRFQWEQEKYKDSRTDRAEDREWAREDRNQVKETRELGIVEKQQRLDAARVERQFLMAKRFSEKAAAVKNPNEWNQLIDYFKGLGYTNAEAYRDFNTGRDRAIRETQNAMDDLKRKRLMLQNQKLERENQVKGQTADNKASVNIAEGLKNLARIPDEMSRNNFESSVGPLQGGDTYILSPLARIGGALANIAGSATTTEVRSRIAGDTEALAAAIKPLIRKPGEGPWTDSDQRRLVAVVGDLVTARSVEEYKRGLENVRQRIMSNFGMQIPAIPGITDKYAPKGNGSPRIKSITKIN